MPEQIWEETSGKIISGAGIQPMHDYEVYPQEVGTPVFRWFRFDLPLPKSCFESNVSIAYLTRHMHK